MISKSQIAELRKDLHLFDIEGVGLDEWTDALDTLEALYAELDRVKGSNDMWAKDCIRLQFRLTKL